LVREKSYSLEELARTQLGVQKECVDIQDVPSYLSTSDGVCHLANVCLSDARLALRLSFKLQMLPLTKQLTCLSGNLWARSMRGQRAERVE
jgi:DNA polymerase alpha subunit A